MDDELTEDRKEAIAKAEAGALRRLPRYAERKRDLIRHNRKVTGQTLSSEAADELMAEIYEDEIRGIMDPSETIFGLLNSVLIEMDEVSDLRPLTEGEARLYFAVERYLFPENEMFLPENLAATEARYLSRTERIGRKDAPAS